MNPFNYDKLPELNDFCGRKNEIKKVKEIIASKNNVLMFGERRYGKTSLIYKVFQELPETVFTLYIDLYDIVDKMDFAQALYNAMIKAMPFSFEEKFSVIADYFSRLEGVSLTPAKTLDGFSLKPNIRDKDFDELLQSAFEGLSKLCDKKGYSHVVIAFDEFQQIKEVKDVKIDAKLRSISQENKKVCFLFSGSKKNMLREIINDKGKPFYGMVTPVVVKGIDPPVLQQFCETKLKTNFIGDSFSYLYNKVRGQTRLVLQVCYRLYAEKTQKIDKKQIDTVFFSLLQDYDEEFKDRFMRFHAMQKKTLKAIVYSKGNKVFSNTILKEISATKQSLSQSLLSLENQDEISKKEEGSYLINDALFSLWLEVKLI